MANEILWGLVNTLIRISALLFIRLVFGVDVKVKLIAWVSIVMSVLCYMALVLQVCLICRPISAAWDTTVSGSCGDQVLSYVIVEIVGMIIDLVIIVLPIPPIWRLKTTFAKRLGMSSLLSFGAMYASCLPLPDKQEILNFN